MESINHAGTCVGILASDGIVLAAERKAPSKLLDTSVGFEKVFQINEFVPIAVPSFHFQKEKRDQKERNRVTWNQRGAGKDII